MSTAANVTSVNKGSGASPTVAPVSATVAPTSVTMSPASVSIAVTTPVVTTVKGTVSQWLVSEGCSLV